MSEISKFPEIKNAPFKYGELEILQEIGNYLASTYGAHYVGQDNIQSMDLILSQGHGTGFCVGNILKYAARYGKKKGFNRDDVLKVIHYAIFLLHEHDKQGR